MSIVTGFIIILIEFLVFLYVINFLPRRWHWAVRLGLALLVTIITQPIAREVTYQAFLS